MLHVNILKTTVFCFPPPSSTLPVFRNLIRSRSSQLAHSRHPLRYYSLTSTTIDQSDPLIEQPKEAAPKRWRTPALISLTAFSVGYLIGTSYPPNLMTQLVINSFLNPPTSRTSLNLQQDSPEAQEITNSIESQLHELQIVKQLNAQPDRWSSYRPFKKTPREKLAHSLTYSTLRGPGKFAIPPLMFINKEMSETVAILHVGDLMCGHEGIVHGGLLATISDEGLAALAFSNLPNKIGVTASLTLNYKKPVLANQFIILRCWLPPDRAPNGRKVWCNGRIENLAGEVLVESESLFVEPKGAKFINNSKIKDFVRS